MAYSPRHSAKPSLWIVGQVAPDPALTLLIDEIDDISLRAFAPLLDGMERLVGQFDRLQFSEGVPLDVGLVGFAQAVESDHHDLAGAQAQAHLVALALQSGELGVELATFHVREFAHVLVRPERPGKAGEAENAGQDRGAGPSLLERRFHAVIARHWPDAGKFFSEPVG